MDIVDGDNRQCQRGREGEGISGFAQILTVMKESEPDPKAIDETFQLGTYSRKLFHALTFTDPDTETVAQTHLQIIKG